MYFTKVIIERALPWLAVLIFATQVLLPLFMPSFKFFWLFRKKDRDDDAVQPAAQTQSGPKKSLDESVEELAYELDADTQKLKQTKKTVTETIDKLSNAKKQSNNSLNNNN